ncbi:MAG: hypothetical protein MI922_18330, partial [Bacteroidales bacterium]|nr:hypothetical protein [Bacteroidales bacterium]
EDNDIFGHTLRYRLKLDHRYNKDFKPYLGSECFYDLTDKEVEKMRLFLGCEFDIIFGSINFYLISENEFENLLADTQFIIGAGYSVTL